MLRSLSIAPPDPILGLNEAFRNDPNPDKINLSVGVYKDADGQTPILECVKEAERRLLASETNKAYLPIDGLASYDALTRTLLLGGDFDPTRGATLQTPGGTGALRVAADFARQKLGAARIWCSKPTWANHPNIFASAGLDVQSYRYLDDSKRALDFEAMQSDLNEATEGDLVCLHACCHNPTGVDPSPEQWGVIAQLVRDKCLLPLVDAAYQGFGEGVEEDVVGLRTLSRTVDEILICSSYSKNFGLYAERIGALTLVAPDADSVRAALSQAKACIRANYSNPPRHGAAIVATVLEDNELKSQWLSEVAGMRDRINGMRGLLAETVKREGVNHDFSFITQQKGMFSFSGLNAMQVDQLRNEHSIYIVGSGRINVAGITEGNIGRLCQAIKEVVGAA